ncbi:hypothetical protein BGX38DRAFT_1167544 [Terfezia claveryi]|nr:hypothetical protein BGX38DRAFT_1167544 [Terfezia claveryi]
METHVTQIPLFMLLFCTWFLSSHKPLTEQTKIFAKPQTIISFYSSLLLMNTSSTQDTLTQHTAMISTNSATTISAAPPTVPPNGRGRGHTEDIDTINVPKLRLRSLSPEKRDLFLRQQTPVSPTKAVYNSEFTGRTFSERKQALKDKAKGLTVKPLPKRKINEVPWLKGNPERVADWEIAQARGKNVRKLTDEEKSLLSPVKATTRAPLVTPPKAAKVALSTTFKGLVKETQTAIRSSRYSLLKKLITNNTQGTVSTNPKSPIKETGTATRVPKHSSLPKLKAQNTREAGVQEPQSAINPSKLAVLWRTSAINIQKTAERALDDSIREPIAAITIAPTGTIVHSPLIVALADSRGHTGSSVHIEHPSRLSSSMALTTSIWGQSTSFRDTEGPAGTVCVPNPLPEDLPHYELIIWRTFARKQDARGNDITPKTRKVSFPITQDFAARIAAGQNLTFVNDSNVVLEGAQDELALLIPLITGSDGILFPPEFMDIADKQFAAIVAELVKFQERGYGRWSLDSLRRRVVADDVAYASGLASHLEAVLVIRMTGFTKKGWLGLPGYDADGDLRIIPSGALNDGRSSSFNSGWSDNSPRNRIPGAGFQNESRLVGSQLSHGGKM